ncbi:serine protease gd-like [Tribolium madens]|uniref:serine protease gd-like n=1 Tax=Tribolium madens TaxID=41895 RepID=UPI001CF7249D|nr:serine protease gd-like [Tribolium madens]
MLRVLFLITVLVSVTKAFLPPVPCPEVFTYKLERGEYYGEIRIPYDGSHNFKVEAKFSVVGTYKNLNPGIHRLTSSDQLRQNAPNVHFKIDFPRLPYIPRITNVVFNEQIFCSGPSEIVTSRGVTNFGVGLTYQSS